MAENRPRILFVDDDFFAIRSYIDELLDAGFHVTPAETVEDALDLARSEVFDLVILDVMMPPGKYFNTFETAGGFTTGKALAREIGEALPDAKIVAFTLSTDPEIEAWFTKDESVAYFHKRDVLPRDLPRLIGKVLRQGQDPPRVFIVHGRDHKTLFELKNFLQNRLGLDEPIVLSEQPSRGMTLIEKFEYYATDADLVFVLFTPDDIGGLADAPESSQARARMNVVFEYGYFLGALRRRTGRVFLLTKGKVEIPSDISGIVYIDISNGVEAAGEAIRIELQDWL